ncbi:MAG: hypothetical protein LBJ38_02010 [Oscillospiraceae bacterium]|jgi:hypothetical protein|nr:hypothetical protein [Oscillospiraceae bacterium]
MDGKCLCDKYKLIKNKSLPLGIRDICKVSALVVCSPLADRLQRIHAKCDRLVPYVGLAVLRLGGEAALGADAPQQIGSNIITNNISNTANHYNLQLDHKSEEFIKKNFLTSNILNASNLTLNSVSKTFLMQAELHNLTAMSLQNLKLVGKEKDMLLHALKGQEGSVEKSIITMAREGFVEKLVKTEVTKTKETISLLTSHCQTLIQQMERFSLPARSARGERFNVLNAENVELVTVILKTLDSVAVREKILSDLQVTCKDTGAVKLINNVKRQTRSADEQINLLMHTNLLEEDTIYLQKALVTAVLTVTSQHIGRLRQEVRQTTQSANLVKRLQLLDHLAPISKLLPEELFIDSYQERRIKGTRSIQKHKQITSKVIKEEQLKELEERLEVQERRIKGTRSIQKHKQITSKVIKEEQLKELEERLEVQERKVKEARSIQKHKQITSKVIKEEQLKELEERLEVQERKVKGTRSIQKHKQITHQVVDDIRIVEKTVMHAVEAASRLKKDSKMQAGRGIGEQQRGKQANLFGMLLLSYKNDVVFKDIQSEVKKEVRDFYGGQEKVAAQTPTVMNAKDQPNIVNREWQVKDPTNKETTRDNFVEKDEVERLIFTSMANNIDGVVDKVYAELEDRLRMEQHRMGMV